MGCGASVGRFTLDETVPAERPAGIQRSVEVTPGIYRKKGFEDGLVGVPPDAPEVKTAWDIIIRSASTHGTINCLGERFFQDMGTHPENAAKRTGVWKDYVWLQYSEFAKQAIDFGKGLVETFELGVGAHVGLYGPSTVQFLVAQYGCFSHALITTPCYDTWSNEILQHVLVHADIEVLIVAQPQLEKAKSALLAVKSQVRGLVILPNAEWMEQFDKEMGKAEGRMTVYSYLQIVEKGKGGRDTATAGPGEITRPPTPESDAVIMYTSGSSGLPKGVQLPHSGFVGVAQGLREASKDAMVSGIVVACFLPLGHIYPTSVVLASFLGGCTTGLYHGDPTDLAGDLKAMQAEVMPGVPRVYQTIYGKAVETFKKRNCYVQGVIDDAVKQQTENVRSGRPRDQGLDRKVFSQIQATLGGKVKYFTTGASKILPTLQEWFQVCFDAHMVEGYGLTEAYGAALLQEADWKTFGDVGAPLCCTEIKLHDVPDFGYSSKDNPPKGELCIRGVNLMRGYYKDAEKTAEEIKDGWLHTGDVATRNSDGTFSIIDRISNVFKLGRAIEGVEGSVLIAPEVIENQLATCSLINQAWIFGSFNYPHLLAVIVPDAAKLLAKAGSSKKFKGPGWQEEVVRICTAEEANPSAWIMAEVSELVAAKKIKWWEQPVRIHLESKLDENGLGFTMQNALLTPTFKLRRGILKKTYSEILANLYKLDSIEWKK